MLNSYISLDIETTGLNPKLDKIMEIGALKVVNSAIVDTFTTLVNPRRDIDESIQGLTGITNALVANAPDIEDIIKDFIEFCGNNCLLGHHIIFDYSFIKKAAVNQGICFERQGIDTLILCRKLIPNMERRNLAALCNYFSIDNLRAHRAESDAMATHLVYQKLLNRFYFDFEKVFVQKPLIFKVKKEQPATELQKQHLRDLIKYHKIDLPVQINFLSRNEVSRVTDKIILQYGRIN